MLDKKYKNHLQSFVHLKNMFPYRESNPGRLGENQES